MRKNKKINVLIALEQKSIIWIKKIESKTNVPIKKTPSILF